MLSLVENDKFFKLCPLFVLFYHMTLCLKIDIMPEFKIDKPLRLVVYRF